MLHKVIARRKESSSTPNIDGTLVTSVLGSFVSSNQQGVITSKSNNNTERGNADNNKSLSIEDVPSR